MVFKMFIPSKQPFSAYDKKDPASDWAGVEAVLLSSQWVLAMRKTHSSNHGYMDTYDCSKNTIRILYNNYVLPEAVCMKYTAPSES